jgi:DNA (cytosine-5)-methyltransferase 1
LATYYNEIDPQAAQWLRNLIAAGHLPEGDVDTRSIEDVHPHELRGYTQAHFFAGIGGWPLALRLAGWPDDRPVWTGSCPCQPFSSAGARAGFDDERHLWPAWYWIIEQCRPPVVFGEQVASKAADDWLDLIQADLEALDYALGAVPFPSASVGAPHIRDRLYWVANAHGHRLQGWVSRRADQEWETVDGSSGRGSATGGLADAYCDGRSAGTEPGLHNTEHHAEPCSGAGGLVYANGRGCGPNGILGSMGEASERGADQRIETAKPSLCIERPGPLHGFWRDADWLACRDGKWRPVEPGTFPLAHGVPGRVVRLRAYGNAINVQQAAEFVRCTTDSN